MLEFRFPDIGEGIDAGELVEWHVAEGQAVQEDEPMADVETDKATVTIPCPTTGRVLELRIKEGDRVPVGEVMAVFEPAAAEAATVIARETAANAPQPPPETAPSTAAAELNDAPAKPPLASPAVRRHAAERGIDLAQIQGSGPGGRIELADLGSPAEAQGTEGTCVIALRGVRRAIARTMSEAWRTIPHIIDYREADAGELLRWRQRLRERADDEQLRRALTVTPLLVKIAVEALKRHPYVNASVDMEREEITLHGEYNIGIATATEDGLVVPVVKGADAKDVPELALEVADLVDAARGRRLQPAQLSGGTFTVNNYGGLGVWLGTPIIKPGEVANLGFGRVQERPVASDGQVLVRPVVALAVSGDHRVLDGHTLGAFVSDVLALIEAPTQLQSPGRAQ